MPLLGLSPSVMLGMQLVDRLTVVFRCAGACMPCVASCQLAF